MITNGRIHYGIGMRGFTLAEAMVAVMVLGIAAASVLLPFMSGAGCRGRSYCGAGAGGIRSYKI